MSARTTDDRYVKPMFDCQALLLQIPMLAVRFSSTNENELLQKEKEYEK